MSGSQCKTGSEFGRCERGLGRNGETDIAMGVAKLTHIALPAHMRQQRLPEIQEFV
jgi:hypothetical protein